MSFHEFYASIQLKINLRAIKSHVILIFMEKRLLAALILFKESNLVEGPLFAQYFV